LTQEGKHGTASQEGRNGPTRKHGHTGVPAAVCDGRRLPRASVQDTLAGRPDVRKMRRREFLQDKRKERLRVQMRASGVADRWHDHARQPHAAAQVVLGDIHGGARQEGRVRVAAAEGAACVLSHRVADAAQDPPRDGREGRPVPAVRDSGDGRDVRRGEEGRRQARARDGEDAGAGGRVAGFGWEDPRVREDGGP